MRVSVVTVCRNAEATIADCASSVIAQRDADIEYIVVDGKSTDGTLERLRPYRSGIADLVSERDEGIYDAMNKGLARATGDIVGFLNADDIFAAPDTISSLVAALKRENADVAFGDVEIFDAQGRLVRIYRAHRFHPGLLRCGMMPPHPSFYARLELLRNAGGFDKSFKIAGDAELMLRVFQRFAPAWTYLPQPIVKMRAGGVSSRGLSSYLLISKEFMHACTKNGVRPNRLAIHSRFILKALEVAHGFVRGRLGAPAAGSNPWAQVPDRDNTGARKR